MKVKKKLPPALIIDPNRHFIPMYDYVSEFYDTTSIPSIPYAKRRLKTLSPSIVFVSSSYPAQTTLSFLTTLKNTSKHQIVPLVFVVDLTQKLNFIPGTTWARRIAVLDSFTTHQQLNSALQRILNA